MGGSPNIDGAYVDGLSITHGTNPRQHIWTYAVGFREDDNRSPACPCNNGTTTVTPSYVGNDYYCESASGATMANTFYPDDIMWDGQQCGSRESPCCSSYIQSPGLLYKTLPQSVTHDIELRMCSYSGYRDEATPIDIIEIYIHH